MGISREDGKAERMELLVVSQEILQDDSKQVK